MQPQKLVLYLWMGCNFLVLGIQYNEWRRSLTPAQIRKLEEYERKQKEKREKDLENAFAAILTMYAATAGSIWK